jgi:integrase
MILDRNTGTVSPQTRNEEILLRILNHPSSEEIGKLVPLVSNLRGIWSVPIHFVPDPRLNPDRHRFRIQPADFEALAAALRSVREDPAMATEAAVLTVLANSGIRGGEFKQLRFKDVLPADHCVRIAYRCSKAAGRLLPISESALDGILALRNQFPKSASILGVAPDRVLNKACRAFQSALHSQTSVPARPYLLRIWLATRLVQAGASSHILQLCMGRSITGSLMYCPSEVLIEPAKKYLAMVEV